MTPKSGMRVQVILYPGMTALDVVGPAQVWSLLPEVTLQYVAETKGPVPTDCGMALSSTHDYAGAWSDPDVVFIGGGGASAFAALRDERLLEFLRQRCAEAAWVTSVCTGALILGAAGLLEGYRAATHWAAREYLVNFGATVSDERVCIDRNRATGGGVTAGIDVALELAGLWNGVKAGRMLELAIEYAPQPPFGTGRPELADPETIAAARTALAGL